MKSFSEPHNPENLPPPAPGYRYLGKDEVRRDDDETMNGGREYWLRYGGCYVDREAYWTIRRAICVDDKNAPPPEEWNKPGFEVVKGPTLCAMGLQVWGYDGWSSYCDGANPEFYYRRPIPNPLMNTSTPSSAPAKVALKPGQAIVVRVHNNKSLIKAIFSVVSEALDGFLKRSGIEYILIRNGEILGSSDTDDYYRNRTVWPDAIFLDARTDMGTLIDLLSTPAIVAPAIRGSDGRDYEAKYIKNADIVTFGCANIGLHLFKAANTLMDDNGSSNIGNRCVDYVVLNSGVKLTREQVKSVLDYVDSVNKA